MYFLGVVRIYYTDAFDARLLDLRNHVFSIIINPHHTPKKQEMWIFSSLGLCVNHGARHIFMLIKTERL